MYHNKRGNLILVQLCILPLTFLRYFIFDQMYETYKSFKSGKYAYN